MTNFEFPAHDVITTGDAVKATRVGLGKSALVRLVVNRLRWIFATGDARGAEILALRHQLLVLQRQINRPQFTDVDRTGNESADTGHNHPAFLAVGHPSIHNSGD